jgi:hypothetical protein
VTAAHIDPFSWASDDEFIDAVKDHMAAPTCSYRPEPCLFHRNSEADQ